jgi:hypothetical protein
MHSSAVVSGILSLLAAGLLSGIGIHDGVLSQTPADEFPATREAAPVTLRVVVSGPAMAASDVLEPLAGVQGTLTVPPRLQAVLGEGGVFVPLDVEGYEPPGAMPVLAHLTDGQTLTPGERLVVTGDLHIHQALVEDADGMRTVPLVILDPVSIRQPLLFV